MTSVHLIFILLMLILGATLFFLVRLFSATKILQSKFTDFVQLNHLFSTRIEDRSTQLESRLQTLSLQQQESLSQTFTDIVKRLALIDAAQKKITELSTHVVNLQEILTDKRSRGAFGEVQLSALIMNMIPASHFSFQHTLSNGKRADCVLFLPAPTGTIAIDAKFPLENYQRFTNSEIASSERKAAEQLFKQDIKKHIQDIAGKYIVPNETADGAMMFIPAEAIFAHIHAEHPDIVELGHQCRVWMVSPTTLMAILTTVRAVIKDEAAREQVHVIQQHLAVLAKDFGRFQARIDHLSKHISQAYADVEEIQASAKKITGRFQKIEAVELERSRLNELTEDVLS